MAKRKYNLYQCKQCGLKTRRNSSKRWVKSYCFATKKDVHLMFMEGRK